MAELEQLSWYQIRQIEINYMNELVGRFGKITRLRAIGIDEISIRKRHTYMICVSDLDKGRPIWIGGEGRREEDLDLFYNTLSDSQKKNISIVVMDMWKPFRKSTLKHISHAQIIYDKFHILRHLSNAMDTVRKQEYRRVNEKERFFANWKSQLKWSRLKPFHQFVKMIERHWDGIVSYCNPNNKVSLGLVEGINNKVRVIQRRAYGIKDREYLKPKILTAFLPEL